MHAAHRLRQCCDGTPRAGVGAAEGTLDSARDGCHIGGVMRFHIRHFEPIERERGDAQEIALLSRMVLSASYFISVTHYLQLLAVFALNIAGAGGLSAARWITTGVLLLIGGIGFWRGVDELESVEKYAVSLNLGRITALLVALLVENVELLYGGRWHLSELASKVGLHDLRVVLGLLIVVQGFETSRYLGDSHPAEPRISIMRTAQLVSTLVYLAFPALATVLPRGPGCERDRDHRYVPSGGRRSSRSPDGRGDRESVPRVGGR
jgi:hypothetical protein